MSLANTKTAYGAVTRSLHWLTALGILIMIPLGWIAHFAPWETEAQLAVKAQLFSVHKTIGVALFFIALFRILWALTQTKPAPLHPERRAEVLAAESVHWLLYSTLVIVPLSGWIEHAATEGFAPILWSFGQDLPFVPNSDSVAEAAASVHFLAQWLLVAALALHVAGALKHAVIDRDGTLARMLRGAEGGSHGASHVVLRPVALALAAWVAVIGGGAAAGMFSTEEAPAAPQLAEAQSDWQVTEGTLAISLVQMGKEIEGSFADWTAEIAFEPRETPGKAGEVTVQIAIPTLTLGSVSKQALGADFFNAEEHPTATFTADILRADSGYEAQGTLTLKGAEVPVTLPFELTLENGTATMQGSTTLDRRNYEIGSSMNDPDQLSFEVAVDVALTATKN
ncbi:cytochrome b/b6 domain-containing protein [Salipiger sp. PrR002]|uniref:cytochrome b/b6 domain-containing protein n=1 Tax=Salipiger sp. PrR002 TaxID=2706489 RepID=UPI0013B7F2A0|nr:cytochrome b/b6 domain-containing protein [Salipiger sp. PrR002]NDW00536.1 cytochrome [Salipiger sp. PrR002]NDW57635.1 cytochrome [Salipiger sp. PrR004]